MATISSVLSPHLLQYPKKSVAIQPQSSNLPFVFLKPGPFRISFGFRALPQVLNPSTRLFAVAEEASVSTKSEAARRLYIGNIPRTVNNSELQGIVEEHGAVEKVEVMYDKYSGRSRRFAFVTMTTVDDANAVVEKLNGTQIGGREIKVNITEKPLQGADLSLLQAEESQFVDSPHKVYVGNLAKTVTSETLRNLFSEKGKVLGAKISRVPGTSKSSGFGFVSFSSDEDVETAISSFNNTLLEGQKIRVNKA